MLRELTPWVLGLTIALSACGDDDEPKPCASGEACEDDEKDPSKAAAGRDAAVRDARAQEQDDVDAETPKARDAGSDATTRDAAPDAATVSDAAAPAGDGSIDSLRQVCVDTINMYRATLSLPPMTRAAATSESCSDDGAEFDSKANKAHGSAAKGAVPCRTASVAQNTCPNWPVRKGSTVADSLKQCLAQMWAEGEPPVGVDACIKDTVCFPKHGHWINMTSGAKLVSCGFYENEKQQWWMNQDFSGR
jgi:hypothetical protein